MTYDELIKKAEQLISEGKSIEEIIVLLKDDIEQAKEYTSHHPEEVVASLTELMNKDTGTLTSMLIGLARRSILEDIEKNSNCK